jgi:hypothetical protein
MGPVLHPAFLCGVVGLGLAIGSSASPPSASGASDDPFAFFQPGIVVSPADRQRLDRGEIVVRILSGQRGELAVIAACAVDASADQLVARMRAIEDLKRSEFVRAIKRFSTPPSLDDLANLRLDDVDLDALRSCRPGDCPVKLAAAEIMSIRRAVDRAGPDWAAAAQDAFRRVVLDRTLLYRSHGSDALPDYADRSDPVRPAAVFRSLLQRSPYIASGAPAFADYLERYPQVGQGEVESFFYWSTERFGGKPTVTVTHVSILRSDPRTAGLAVLVAGKQILATHYVNGALSLTALVRDGGGGSNYLVYVNRSQVDVLGGLLGPMKRAIVESRIRRETDAIFRGLRTRLETGG